MFTFMRQAGGAESDPYFGNVVLLLHGDGTNGGTTFTDSSSYNRTVSILAGTPTTSTAQSKFGGASIYGGTGSPQLTFTCGAEGAAATEWTFETWIRRNANGDYHGLLYANNGNLDINLYANFGAGNYAVSIGATGSPYLLGATPLALNTWYHVAVTRRFVSGVTYRTSIWVDGVEDAFAAGGPQMTLQSITNSIGRTDLAGFAGLNDYLDEYRITMGVARYTATFTPPTAAFPNS